MNWKVPVGISNHHVHLTKETYEQLFCEKIEKLKDLKQTGEYASKQTVTIKGPKGEIEKVRILGPFRSYNQVEISNSDAFILGIKPPVRKSGDLENAEKITIIGENGSIELQNSCIIAENHIHMDQKDLIKYQVEDNSLVKVLVEKTRKGCFFARIKASENGILEFHIDRDEANAFQIENEEELTVQK